MKYFLKLVIIVLFLAGCATTAEPAATPPPTATSVPTATSLPTDTPVPTATPTPAPLKPNEVFDLVSSSIAFIETETGSGSGVLVDGGYVVTNAHVVWPFDKVRVVFPDGMEFEAADVPEWDMIGDLAIIGPLDTDLPALELVDGESLIIGSDVYLIGYPGEVEEFPQPTISRGLISRMREWGRIGMTYFQTDAAIAGGQSGGVLVSEMGDVVGISGFTFADAEFGLVASAADINDRVKRLIAGEDVDEMNLLGDRRPLANGRDKEHRINMSKRWDSPTFVIWEENESKVEIEVESEAELIVFTRDAKGSLVDFAKKLSKFDVLSDIPYFATISKTDDYGGLATIKSNVPLSFYEDRDSGGRLFKEDLLLGGIDFPGDIDSFSMVLDKGDIVNIRVESVMVDPVIIIDFVYNPVHAIDEVIGDDNSGGGVFGTDAEITYEATESGTYDIVIQDASGFGVGGYYITVGDSYDGAPTPVAPTPTPAPVQSKYGALYTYQSESIPTFTIMYPAEWTQNIPSDWGGICSGATVCFFSQQSSCPGHLMITENSLQQFGTTLSREEYVEMSISNLREQGMAQNIEHQIRENQQGFEIDTLTYDWGQEYDGWELIYYGDEVAYHIAYYAPYTAHVEWLKCRYVPEIKRHLYAPFDEFVQYSFDTFQVLDD